MTPHAGLRTGTIVALVLALMAGSVALQAARDRHVLDTGGVEAQYLYVPSGEVVRRLALSHRGLVADVYWIRAIQHYGGTRRMEAADRRYDLLYPLLDIATTLDPHFNIVYRFGAIFLAEPYPAGPGRPDLAIELLKKGFRHNPSRWQYLMDIGFVHYWWLHDFSEAAAWFRRAAGVEGSPEWLRPLAATTLAQGGDRGSSRTLWQQIHATAEQDWLRAQAERRLVQLDALDDIDRLLERVWAYWSITGGPPGSWSDLIAAGLLQRLPRDPAGHAYTYDPEAGRIDVSPDSPLFPLPLEPAAMAPAP